MKELSIEEKAKAYDEALERAKELLEVGVKDTRDKKVVLSFFPELAESKDESIRKAIIKYFTNGKEYLSLTPYSREDYIAWLEKQGEQKFEQKFFINDKVVHKATGKIWTIHYYLKDTNSYYVEDNDGLLHHYRESELKLVEQKPDDIDNKFIRMHETKPKDISEFLHRLTTVEQEFLWEHIAKIRKLDKEEQKYAGKVKPRFKFGNWVVIDSEVLFIKEVTEDGYLTDEGGLIPFRYDKEAHLWTIQDVKEGDVLHSPSHHLIWIYKDNEHYYVNINLDYADAVSFDNEIVIPSDVRPANRVQKSILFQKMHEAGYEWDAEKKELKKIVQKPILDVEIPFGTDSELVEEAIAIPDGCYAIIEDNKVILRKGEKKSSWNEEDEENLKWFEKFFRAESVIAEGKDIPQDRYLWFKNLKDRVQP